VLIFYSRHRGRSYVPPSTYDEPCKPFDALLKDTGCSADSIAVTCLKAVPSDVYFSHFVPTCVLKLLTDIDEHKQYSSRRLSITSYGNR
jgi:hypothetical protein